MKITKLTSLQRTLAKQITLSEQGEFQIAPYDSAKTFYAYEIPIKDINELSALLTDLENERFSCLIRGLVSPDVDLSQKLRRRKYIEGKDPQEYPFIDEKQSWILIDIDNLALPDEHNYIQNPEEVVKYAISQLPKEFHDTTCHWQYSSSAGIKQKDLIKLHLWFWLETPQKSYLLRQWANAVNESYGLKLIDPALFNPVQVHYTANPIFYDKATDPIPVRSGLLKSKTKSVKLDMDFPIAQTETKASSSQPSTPKSRTYSLPLDEARGFDNFLSKMGDQPGGFGFYEPLLKATSSLVATKGTEWVKHNLDAVLIVLQEHIDDANQSNHSNSEIERYRSEAYLKSLIQSAIDRGFGDEVKAEPPYYNAEQLSLEEGENKLIDAIRRFHACIVMANKKRSATPLTEEQQADFSTRKQNLAIKARAGLGKTSQIIREIISMRVRHDEKVNIEYYIPTHDLGKQVESDLKQAFSAKVTLIESITNESVDVDINVIRGRTNETPDGDKVCQKHTEATKLNDLGKSVEFLLCDNGSEKCEFYDSCLYQQQFRTNEATPTELNLPTVNIMAHNHLFHQKRDLLPTPEFIVVDESFYQAGIQTIEIPLDKIRGSRNDLTRIIYDAIYDEHPLLKSLRDSNITPDMLTEEAQKHKPQLGISNISPSMPWIEQQRELHNITSEYHKIDSLLITLADELSLTDRDESFTITKNRDTAIVKRRMEMNVPDDVPILFIDADLNRNITNLFRPDTEVIKIPVERQATVHQFNRTWSAFSLDKDENKIFLKETIDFIDLVTSTGSTLIVTSKTLRTLLTGESAATMPVQGEYHDAAIVHFSNLRGINDYESYQNVIIIGREQPPAKAMEALAKGLWWDSSELIKCVPSESGNYPYQRDKRGYRMRNGSPEDTTIQLHPDKRVQDILELSRESEITQGIDRLRLVRGEKSRQVFILTSIPVDITVDHLWNWGQLQEFLTCWDESGGILPLRAEDLLKALPNSTLTVRGAKDLAARLKKTLSLIYILISPDVLFGSYRTNNPKGIPPKVIISSKYLNPKKALEEKLGEPILNFEKKERV